MLSPLDTPHSTATKEFAGEQVKVAVRCRPLMPQEIARHDKSIIQVVDERTIQIDAGQGKGKQFTFNAVIGEKCQQMDVF